MLIPAQLLHSLPSSPTPPPSCHRGVSLGGHLAKPADISGSELEKRGMLILAPNGERPGML